MFLLKKCFKKETTFLAQPPTKRYIRGLGLPEGGCAAFCLGGGGKGGGVPLIVKKILDL
jgi:hypothetical protein